ncbi:LLM class flavin-dependent oxidoreductase [Streptosporangiaceae bacterium NEAU-GS5]|nr:LLM class flavin-dependent oxidoreductase [Streptosporangiaceae bacterium NEAU-GS5]
MKFSLLYPVTVGPPDRLGTGLLGLEPELYSTAVDELREQAVAADETGWTSLMLSEQHFEVEGYEVTPNPLLVDVFLAQHTTRLRLGQMGLALPLWNPLRLAEDIAVADHLTGGRLDVGLTGSRRTRSAGLLAHPAAAARDRRLFEEWFEVMRLSWTEELWSYDGRFIQVPPPGISWSHPISERLGAGVTASRVTRIGTVPKPLQLPHPPLFTLLTEGDADVEWAARVGSTLVTAATDPAAIRGVCDTYNQAAVRHGRNVYLNKWKPGGGVALCRLLAVGRTHEQARRTGEQALAYVGDWIGQLLERIPGENRPVPRTFDELVESGAMLAGTPDEIGEQVAALGAAYGVDHLMFVACAGATDHGRMLDTITLFGEHVIPELTEAA